MYDAIVTWESLDAEPSITGGNDLRDENDFFNITRELGKLPNGFKYSLEIYLRKLSHVIVEEAWLTVIQTVGSWNGVNHRAVGGSKSERVFEARLVQPQRKFNDAAVELALHWFKKHKAEDTGPENLLFLEELFAMIRYPKWQHTFKNLLPRTENFFADVIRRNTLDMVVCKVVESRLPLEMTEQIYQGILSAKNIPSQTDGSCLGDSDT